MRKWRNWRDASDLSSGTLETLWVRIPSSAPGRRESSLFAIALNGNRSKTLSKDLSYGTCHHHLYFLGGIIVSWSAKQKEKQRLKRLHEQTKTWYGTGCFLDKKGVLRRYYPYSTNHDNLKKAFRRISNRKFRRMSIDSVPTRRNGHKLVFDLWWELY